MTDEQQQAAIQKLRTADEYDFFDYPKVLYRDRPKGFKPPTTGAWVPDEPFETLIVEDEAAELAALDDGYRTTPVKAG
jgi:hypothetical protein